MSRGCYCSSSKNASTVNNSNHSTCNLTCSANCKSSSTNCEYCGDNRTVYASIYTISN